MSRRLIILAMISLSIPSLLYAQDYKAKFIHAFTRYMDWPAESKKGHFNIGVYGSFDLYKAVAHETMGKTVGHQNIAVSNIFKESQLNLTHLHMLVISKEFCDQQFLEQLSEKLKATYTLIVTESNCAAWRADISFSNEGGSLYYIYNPQLIHRKNIAMSTEFKKMGRSSE